MTKSRVALCAIAKLENHYIREWVDYHINLGFDKIFLYDNNDIDGEYCRDALIGYDKLDKVEIIDARGKEQFQVPAFNECYQAHKQDFDWVMFMDIDEFLTLTEDTTIQEFVSHYIYKRFNCIFIHWNYYDDNNLVSIENNNYSVIERFKNPCATPGFENFHGKRITRTNIPETTINSCHGPINETLPDEVHTDTPIKNFNIKCCNSEGCVIKNDGITSPTETLPKAYIKHYKFKTIQEYVEGKMARGYPIEHMNRGKDMKFSTFFAHNQTTVEKLNWAEQWLKTYTGPNKEELELDLQQVKAGFNE